MTTPDPRLNRWERLRELSPGEEAAFHVETDDDPIAQADLICAGCNDDWPCDFERGRRSVPPGPAFPDFHVVEFTPTAYHLEHPLTCRERGLRLCDWQGYLAYQNKPLRETGRYVMTWDVLTASFTFAKETP